MPNYGSRRTLPGWEPGARYHENESAYQQWYGVTRLKSGGGVEWVREVPFPAPNPSNEDKPCFSVGGGVGFKDGCVFGVFSGDKPPDEPEKFLWFYRYSANGQQIEKVQVDRQLMLRTYPGNDLIMDKEGRLWLPAYPTIAGEESSNLMQVWRMPAPT